MTDAYEFRIAGRLSRELLGSFEPRESHRDGEETVFVCSIVDDSQLFGLIARCELLGLHLVGLRKLDLHLPPEWSA